MDITNECYSRTTVRFSSRDQNGTLLEAWLYTPSIDIAEPTPPQAVVVMAHGLGGQRDFGLHKTADMFACAGAAALVFDYRTFGGSDGEPRHFASPSRQLEDWRAAIAFVQHTLPSAKLVLWGTSYSGGHVLVLGAELGHAVAGVISQVPYLSGKAAVGSSLRARGVLPSLRLVLTGLCDVLGSRLGLPPVYVRLAGPHGSMSAMALTERELQAWAAKHPVHKLGGWRNQLLARFALETTRYAPIKHVPRITSPVMLLSARRDSLCPHETVAAAGRLLSVEVLSFDVDHFGLYMDETWQHAAAAQRAFVCKVTGMPCAPTAGA